MKPSFSEKLDYLLVYFLARKNYENYVSSLKLKQDSSILEVGCGGGNLSKYLIKKVPQGDILSIDYSSCWINLAKKRLGKNNNIHFENIGFFDLSSERKFDSIILHYILHDIEKNKRTNFVGKLEENLKENGKVFLREPIRKKHGIPPEEIKNLFSNSFHQEYSKVYSKFPLRGLTYESSFKK